MKTRVRQKNKSSMFCDSRELNSWTDTMAGTLAAISGHEANVKTEVTS